MEQIDGKNAAQLASDIRALTRQVQSQCQGEVEVRWFDGPVGNSIIMANPGSEGAWARVELLVPFQTVDKRPSFRVEKAKNRDLFGTFYDSYSNIWQKSCAPDV